MFRIIFDLVVLVILIKKKIYGLGKDVCAGNNVDLGIEVTSNTLSYDFYVYETGDNHDEDEA